MAAWISTGIQRSTTKRAANEASSSTMPPGIFLGRTVEAVDRRRDYGEERIRAIGEIDGRVYVVIYTDRARIRWIISAWKASGKDVRTWRNNA
jgi:uncharacterized DUF497 family protein